MNLPSDIIKSILLDSDNSSWIKFRLTCKYVFNLANDGETRCIQYIKRLELEKINMYFNGLIKKRYYQTETPFMRKIRISQNSEPEYSNNFADGNISMYSHRKNKISDIIRGSTISGILNNSNNYNNFYRKFQNFN